MSSVHCEVELQVGSYKDKIICDVMPMDVCHILLGRPWQFDRSVIHDGKKNTYKFQKDGINHTLVPLQEEGTAESNDSKALLLRGKDFLQQMEDSEVNFALVCKPKVIITTTKITDLYLKIQEMLNEYNDIIVDDLPNELPPVRSISHHIDLIPGASLPNKAAYRMTPQENEENQQASSGAARQGTDQRKSEPMCCANSAESKERWHMENVHILKSH